MPLPHYQKISSLSSVKNTILTDYFAYNWFYYLIHKKEISSRLKSMPKHLKFYDDLKGLSYAYNFIVCLLIATCLLFIVTTDLYFGLLSGAFILLAYLALRRKRLVVSTVAEEP